jgi:hypothetical protein
MSYELLNITSCDTVAAVCMAYQTLGPRGPFSEKILSRRRQTTDLISFNPIMRSRFFKADSKKSIGEASPSSLTGFVYRPPIA